jgi:hypothetical protein
MPLYNYAGEYTVFCFKTGTKLMPGRYRNLSKYVLIKGNLEGLADFYEIRIKGFNFSPINIVLPKEDIYTLRDSNGEILAACGVWNQQGCKQYIITGYKGVYKYLRHLPLKMLGYPRFPRENEPVNYASIAMLCVKDNNAELAQYFVKMVAERSTGFDFLMAGFLERHPLMPAFIGIKHIKYQSRLYTVQWQDAEDILDGRPINLEVGLL